MREEVREIILWYTKKKKKKKKKKKGAKNLKKAKELE